VSSSHNFEPCPHTSSRQRFARAEMLSFGSCVWQGILRTLFVTAANFARRGGSSWWPFVTSAGQSCSQPRPSARIVVRALTFIPDNTRNNLISLIPRSGAEKRAQICWVLGHRAKRSAVPALLELLRDSDLFVRIAAIRALGEIGDDSAISAIESAASGGQPAVREIARKALAMLGVHQML